MIRQISVAIPTWEREDLLFKSFEQVYDDSRISEIIIVDDCSNLELFNRIKVKCDTLPKVKLYRNISNVDCYRNKMTSASYANNEWVCIWDSDNVFGKDYLDAIYAIPEWDKRTLYQPQWSKPYFDFREWSGLVITKENVAQYTSTHLMTALNAFNLFINRDEYLIIWDGSVDPITSDSIYFNYCWLNASNKVLITPGLEYEHYIAQDHSGHYEQNQHRTVEFHENLMQKIRNLK